MLREKINKDFVSAFRNKDKVKKDLLSVIKSEIQSVEKKTNTDLSDNEVIKILNKTSKSLKETIKNNDDKNLKYELKIVESYLPKQMTEDEIREKIKSLYQSGANNMGAFMKEFKTLSADKKLVSQIAREYLT